MQAIIARNKEHSSVSMHNPIGTFKNILRVDMFTQVNMIKRTCKGRTKRRVAKITLPKIHVYHEVSKFLFPPELACLLFPRRCIQLLHKDFSR